MLAPLTTDDLGMLSGLKGKPVHAGKLVHRGADDDAAFYVLSGWCARMSTNAGGGKIVTLLLPGDGFGLGAHPWAGDSLPVCALSDSVVLDAGAIRGAVRAHSVPHARLIEACERASWLDQTYALNHIVRLSGQNAYQRVAHLVAELFERLGNVGLAEQDRFILPVRQQVIADFLGLSGVHFNRIARQMKHDGLIDFLRGAVCVLDSAKLKELTGSPSSTADIN
jgi:Crp-like helix-turn-helix domain